MGVPGWVVGCAWRLGMRMGLCVGVSRVWVVVGCRRYMLLKMIARGTERGRAGGP